MAKRRLSDMPRKRPQYPSCSILVLMLLAANDTKNVIFKDICVSKDVVLLCTIVLVGI